MICQKCKYPHANATGCISCGWKHDPNYHPDLGAHPRAQAKWAIREGEDGLTRHYGEAPGKQMFAAAVKYMTENPDPEPVFVPFASKVECVSTQPVAPPDFSAAPVEPEVVPEPEPIVDERIHAQEAEAPTA